MKLTEDSLVTGHAGHEIFVIRNGIAHWVPDTWTMHAQGLTPRSLIIIEDEDLERIPVGADLPTAVPSPRLPDGTIVETESGVWHVYKGRLDPIRNRSDLRAAALDATRLVVWLPDSIVRAARRQMVERSNPSRT